MDLDTFMEMYETGSKSYHNYTRVYMAPLMNYYGEIFRMSMRKLEHTAVGIMDMLHKEDDKYCLYFLINTSSKKSRDFDEALNHLSSYNFFVRDYPFGEVFENRLHMLVFRIPDELQGAYDAFVESRYSKMLSQHHIDTLFRKIYGDTKAVKVMMKDKKYKEDFERSINSICIIDEKSTWITLPDDAELDFMLDLKHEIFNYKK
jgi:hypothetical protein